MGNNSFESATVNTSAIQSQSTNHTEVPLCEKNVKAIFHCSRFACAGGATKFTHVKYQSRQES